MTVQIFVGDCRDVLRGFEAGSVHCCVTSPPYWSQRDYGIEPVVWGGDGECRHVWGNKQIQHQRGKVGNNSTLDGGPQSGGEGRIQVASTGQFCQLCGAWLGCLGNEPMPSMYVSHLVEVFREVWRVLRDDGIFWLNLGDSYFGDSPTRKKSSEAFSETWDKSQTRSRGGSRRSASSVDGLKPKDLVGIPWRAALALQADGWWLRSAMPWVKKSAMPESVQDRCTTAHEYIFQFTKSARYFYDNDAIRSPTIPDPRDALWNHARTGRGFSDHEHDAERGRMQTKTQAEGWVRMSNPAGRNRRTSDTFNESLDIRIKQQRAYLAHLEHIRDNGGMMLSEDGSPVAMLVNTASFKGSHFATFPTKLVEPLIACSTSERGACPKCGAQWERVVERQAATSKKCPKTDALHIAQGGNGEKKTGTIGMSGGGRIDGYITTLGWRPTCECSGLVVIGDQPSKPSEPKRKKGESKKEYAAKLLEYDADLALWQTHMDSWRQLWADLKPLYDAETTIPATVLDPFVGAGTTLLQADRMGRHAKGIDVSEAYVKMAAERIVGDAPLLVNVVLFSDVMPVPAAPTAPVARPPATGTTPPAGALLPGRPVEAGAE
jgi:DNA modification methylase